ncbi:extended synaptotagmin-1, partial [Trifolium pratense]
RYQIGLRYTGGARMLLSLSLKFGIIPIVVPVGVRDFDIDGELWVKLRLIPTAPWVGAASWAFVSLPKIKFELSPFRLFNLMAIPVLSMFLTKLLTVDLPRLFVRPNKIVLDFQKGKAVGPVTVGPVADDVKSGEMQEGNKDSVGELSVTLVDARKLPYIFGKTDPYVVLSLGDQTIRSKKNSQTTVIGAPGMPIWNQDFHMLVSNPKKQKLSIQVKDALGFADLPIGLLIHESSCFRSLGLRPAQAWNYYTDNFQCVNEECPGWEKVGCSWEGCRGFQEGRERIVLWGSWWPLAWVEIACCSLWVDLGSLQDTVPTDRIVVLQGGWGFLRKGSSGEILLRLTYKAYVEDEEDDKTEEDSIDIDVSDDELSDTEEANDTDNGVRGSVDQTDKESFMDVLAAIIVSEEFQGIVASEAGYTKGLDNGSNTGSKVSKSPVANTESIPSSSDTSQGSGGTMLL